MAKWRCTICGHIYDEALGDQEHGIEAGTLWQDVPDLWLCPDCGAFKEDFEQVTE
ncbi:MAG: rubredoxin [Methylophilaceae bacterium]|nr:rubredoxin [Methylophilaceae bacterium]